MPLFMGSFYIYQFSDYPVFLNPPVYCDIKNWIDWAIENHKRYGKHCYFNYREQIQDFKLLEYGCDLEFIKGRFKFGNAKMVLLS